MIHDSKAEALEARGLYRRAAARWAEVIMLANDDKAREQAAKRRAECIHKAARPPARQDNFGEMRETISRTHAGMGLHQPNGEAFRKYQKRTIVVSNRGWDSLGFLLMLSEEIYYVAEQMNIQLHLGS